MEKCATLRRVSSDGQDVENQQPELDCYTAEHNYYVARPFDLPDTSASKGLKRHLNVLAEIVADMEAGLYTVLVVTHSSRIDRRDEDEQLWWLLQVRRAGGRIESVREPNFGKKDITGRVTTDVAQWGNAEYSRALSANVKAGNARLDAKGIYRGGQPPFGYRVAGTKHNHFLEPVPGLVPVLREIFKRAAMGHSLPRIRAWLLAEYQITKTTTRIAFIIRYSMYWTGRYLFTDHTGVVRVHGTTPVITSEVWGQANAALDARGSTNPRGPRKPRRPDYSGSVRCGNCGAKAYRSWNGGPKDPVTREVTRRRFYYCQGCKRSWDADMADARIEARMSGDTSPEVEVRIITPSSDHKERLAVVTEALRTLSSRNLPDEDEDRERRRLRAQRDELEALPAGEPPRRELVFTGRTRGQAWDAMSHLERVAYLRSGEFSVTLCGRARIVDARVVWAEG